MGRNLIETLMGALVIIVAAFFILISYKSGNLQSGGDSSYVISAKFKEIGSLSVGSDVRLSGIKIGVVSEQSLDSSSYKAILKMSIDQSLKIPTDSSASIIGDGLLGGKYLSINPGSEDRYLKDGGQIRYTQDAVSLEELLAKFAFGSVDDSDSN